MKTRPDATATQPAQGESSARTVSEKQLAANRRNAQKSTGPRTAEGKDRSRGNALKHGMTGSGAVLRPEDEARLPDRIADWAEHCRPTDKASWWLVRRAALATLRIDNCERREAVALRLQRRGQDARDEVLETAEAARRAEQFHSDPVSGLAALQQIPAGCEWLLERWIELTMFLQRKGRWELNQYRLACRLLGHPHPHTAHIRNARIMELRLAYLALQPHPDPQEVMTTLPAYTGQLRIDWTPEEVRKLLPDADSALRTLQDAIVEETNRLEARAAMLRATAAVEPDEADDLAALDLSAAGDRARRYESAAESTLFRCLRHLTRPTRPAPDDDGRTDTDDPPTCPHDAPTNPDPEPIPSPQPDTPVALPPETGTGSDRLRSVPVPLSSGDAPSPVALPPETGTGSDRLRSVPVPLSCDTASSGTGPNSATRPGNGDRHLEDSEPVPDSRPAPVPLSCDVAPAIALPQETGTGSDRLRSVPVPLSGDIAHPETNLIGTNSRADRRKSGSRTMRIDQAERPESPTVQRKCPEPPMTASPRPALGERVPRTPPPPDAPPPVRAARGRRQADGVAAVAADRLDPARPAPAVSPLARRVARTRTRARAGQNEPICPRPLA